MPDLPLALGNKGRELEERIFITPDTSHRIQILASFLEQQFHKREQDDHPPITAVRHVIQSDQNHTVRELAAAGATTVMEISDEDYGRTGGVRDSNGNTWLLTFNDIAAPLPNR